MSRFPLAVVSALLVWPATGWAQPATPEPPAGEATPAQTQPAPSEAEPAAPPSGAPPSHYYVEPADPNQPRAAQPAPAPPRQGAYEPPPPGYGYGPQAVWEPPPPPKPHHLAPKYALWFGARLAWFVPFGNLWGFCPANAQVDGFCMRQEGVAWSEYGSSGPAFELDVGARLGRNYNLFLLWERAELGNGSAEPDEHGGQQGGDTDFWALGLRVSSNPDKVGFLTEIALGYRRFRAVWEDGTELRLTDAPFEARIGLGADIRLSRAFSLSPLVTLGVGAFGEAELVNPDGSNGEPVDRPFEFRAGHGWLTIGMGGHFDIGGGE